MTIEEKQTRLQELERKQVEGTLTEEAEVAELQSLKEELGAPSNSVAEGEVTQPSSDEAPVDATPEGEAEVVKEEETAAV